MFRIVPLSIIRSFSLYTQQWYMSYRFADSLRAGSGRNWFRPDHEHVEFYSKNKFQKLVHVVGFIIRIYHDARSPERQILGLRNDNTKTFNRTHLYLSINASYFRLCFTPYPAGCALISLVFTRQYNESDNLRT